MSKGVSGSIECKASSSSPLNEGSGRRFHRLVDAQNYATYRLAAPPKGKPLLSYDAVREAADLGAE